MSDTMQFLRELLSGQQQGHAIRGTVTHSARVFTDDPQDPALYDLQLEVDGYTYTGMVFTRDPNLAQIPDGIEVLVSQTTPGSEGYPAFLYMVAAPAQPAVQQAAPPPPPMQTAPQPQQQQVAPQTVVAPPPLGYPPMVPPHESSYSPQHPQRQGPSLAAQSHTPPQQQQNQYAQQPHWPTDAWHDQPLRPPPKQQG